MSQLTDEQRALRRSALRKLTAAELSALMAGSALDHALMVRAHQQREAIDDVRLLGYPGSYRTADGVPSRSN